MGTEWLNDRYCRLRGHGVLQSSVMDKWVALMWTVGWLLRGAASLIGLRRQTSRHYIHYAHYFNTPVFNTVMDWQVAISSSQTARYKLWPAPDPCSWQTLLFAAFL